MSIHRKMDKQLQHSHTKEYYQVVKKELTTDPQQYGKTLNPHVKQKKPDTKEDILCHSIDL